MNHLRRLGDSILVPIQPDQDGLTGRECPNCEGYFKIEFGTGLKGKDLPCHCPYCGHSASHDQFWTKEQIEYAKSVALRKVGDAIYRDLKELEFDYKPKGSFGIGFSLKVKPGRPIPIHYYREKQLETEIVCDNCTLHYSVYGVFAFCPDCGQHNSLQILDKNLAIVGKMLDMTRTITGDLAEKLIENALEDCVSAFDGFGRELCRVYAKSSSDPAKAEKVSFQNLEGAAKHVRSLYNLDIAELVAADEWMAVVRSFQKRHVLVHKMGVADDEYVRKTGDSETSSGHKVTIRANEVRELVRILSKLAKNISEGLRRLP